MPDKKSSESDSTPSRGVGRYLIVAVLCIALLGGGYALGGGLGGGAAGATTGEDGSAEEGEVEEAPIETIAAVVDLDAVNVNLADGHYLRVAVSVGLSEVEAGGGGHGGDEEVHFETAPAADLVLTTLSGRRMEELADADGREAARHDLEEGLVAYYGEGIVTVLLREFVMQ